MRRLLLVALRDHCKHEHDWTLGFWTQLWLTAKCIVAILLRREVDLRYSESDLAVSVAYYDWRKTSNFEYGEGAEGMVLQTRRYGWPAFEEIRDGWP